MFRESSNLLYVEGGDNRNDAKRIQDEKNAARIAAEIEGIDTTGLSDPKPRSRDSFRTLARKSGDARARQVTEDPLGKKPISAAQGIENARTVGDKHTADRITARKREEQKRIEELRDSIASS